ncbi:50S ribosomal protein L29 [Xylocopilactobacillus apicola]|uniref:Large ribosomal subunit protein uL29 n=1 Tax=Xylocopilactobacillus apicola TaxID=2932184 RepID=A0AAU9DAP3_9LACO|nr:50S ribosomal protein L29 [Xylocopilactobacillus apicola]BDR59531.1 50S ribosomal protein L29 [Xylocopilactobacillus apicola]
MKASEIRKLSTSEMIAKEEEYRKELFNLRFQQATGNFTNTARLKKVKKNIARILTILTEQKRGES